MVPGLVNEVQNPSGIPVSKKDVVSTEELIEREKPSHDLVLKSFRLLIADLCQQFGGGHPG
jgi:dihydroxyacetone synthase